MCLDVLGDNRLSSHDSVLTNRYPGHYHRSYAYERTVLDGNLFGDQLKGGVAKVVCTRAKVGFLSNRDSFHNLDFSKRVCNGSFAETCAVMHSQMPWDLNSSC